MAAPSDFEYELWGRKVEIRIPKEKFPTDEEIADLENRMPGSQHGWFRSTFSSDEKEIMLHYRYVLPKGTPKAVIVYEHGIHSSCSTAWVLEDGTKLNFALLIDYYVKERGYALYGLDMLGHGFSEGERFLVPDYKINRDDLAEFSKFVSTSLHPNTPFFLQGESYGSCLCLHAARLFQDDPPKGFGGICVTAPAIVGNLPPAPVVFVLRNLLAPLYPRWTPFFMPNPVSPDRIWTDDQVRELNTAPRRKEMGLTAPGTPFCLGTAVQMLAATEDVREKVIPTLTVPFCAAHGTSDYAVMIEGTEYLEANAKTAKEDFQVLRVEGAYHDLMGSIEHARPTLKSLDEFIQKRMAKMSSK